MIRTASAHWQGTLKEGNGTISNPSGGLKDTAYSFGTRFGDGVGVNPEELIASAHAACFSMALSGQLGQRDIVADAIDTVCAITMENATLTKSELTTTVKAAGADKAKVEEAAAAAKAGCPISKVLNLEITLELTVEV
jgi:lipoyl-dependent peroxiredoxin